MAIAAGANPMRDPSSKLSSAEKRLGEKRKERDNIPRNAKASLD
jgi:hypothetical protein